LSATNIERLTAVWEEEYRQFRKRRLEGGDYVYVWADWQKELIAVEDGCPRVRRVGRRCCGI
jgi:hypothetical protein